MSPKIQDAWKVILDTATKINFIFITNEIENLTAPVKSRFTKIEYNYTDEELKIQKINYINNIIKICKDENIPYNNDGVKQLFIKHFPDFRQILIILQQFIDNNQEVNLQNVLNLNESSLKDIELYEMFNINSSQEFYQKATQYKGREKDALLSLGEPFFEYLNAQGKFDKTLRVAMIVSAYSNQYINTFNKFVCLFSCLTEIKNVLR